MTLIVETHICKGIQMKTPIKISTYQWFGLPYLQFPRQRIKI